MTTNNSTNRRTPALAASNSQVSHTGDTAGTTLVDVLIPANTLPANGIVKITTLWSRNSSGSATVTPRIRFSTITGALYSAMSMSTTSLTLQTINYIYANNSTGAQKAWGLNSNLPYQISNSALVTSSVDTTADTHLVITLQCGNSGDTGNLESYIIELLQQ